MNDDAPPTLYPSATELWQYAQAITSISNLAARVRMLLARARERAGRLAFAEDEHAARLHEARQHPPLRAMTEDERASWQDRVPAELAHTATADDGACSVWTAHLVDADGTPTGEWGLEAHTWTARTATASLFVVCRDAEDALALTRHLREHGTSEELARLSQLAASQPGRFVQQEASGPQLGRHAPALVLNEAEWEAALRTELPANLADKIIVKDPAHPHHVAWRELHELANGEVARLGVDPSRLAALVHRVPRWRDDIRNPAALAHWAITQARSSADYAKLVAAPMTATKPEPTAAPVLIDVHTPGQALAWARGLDPTDATHRVEAKLGFGRWGSTVDAILAERFPGITERTNVAAGRRPVEPDTDSATLAELAAEVERLDPTKPIDRRAAHVMLGRVPPEIDRLLADKFGQDPQFAEKLHTLYPDGLPDADAATWRNRATGTEGAAAAQAATGDDPRTPQREDITGRNAAARELGIAAQQHGIAAATANRQAAPTRQIVTVPGPTRRAL
jgi:hypothetical protein